MKIVKCKKMSNGKYKVSLDNGQEMIIYEDVIVQNELLGKELDATTLLKIDSDNRFADIYNKAIKYIGVRLRSIKEMEEYLQKKNINQEECKEIVERLKVVGLLNDEMFARAYMNDKMHLTNQGFVKIKNQLLQHHIDGEIIDRLISQTDVDYDNRIKNLVKKQLQHHKGKSKFVIRNKIYHYLLNLGYDSGDILKNLDLNQINDEDELVKEYERLYRKLSKKYDKQEIAVQLKRSLYHKGFDYGKIEEFIASKNES